MRWMQLATFLPVIRYARLPSDCDPQVLQLTKNLTTLRQQVVRNSFVIKIQEFFFHQHMSLIFIKLYFTEFYLDLTNAYFCANRTSVQKMILNFVISINTNIYFFVSSRKS